MPNKWPFRHQLALLSILAVQNTALILILKNVMTKPGSRPATLNVILVEVLKIILCVLLELPRHNYRPVSVMRSVMHDPHLPSYALPALIYAVQNNLCLVAVRRLGTVEYQVLYQSKVLTTAMFAWALLGKPISGKQWASLVLLLTGTCVVIVPGSAWSDKRQNGVSEEFIGAAAIISAAVTSGFCGVYLEKMVKSAVQRKRTVALQSIGLAVFSLPAAILLHSLHNDLGSLVWGLCEMLKDGKVLFVCALQAASGLLVGAVMRHSDNVLKGFATCTSLVLSTAITSPGNSVVVGTVLVALAIVVYGSEERFSSMMKRVRTRSASNI
jgi:UDP-sugar transporter A1/2/3